MECDKIREHLSEHLDGLLSPEEAQVIDRHLALCPECRRRYSELKLTVSHLRGLEQVEPPSWMTGKIMSRIQREKKTGILPRIFPPLSLKLPLQTAATVLIAIGAVYLFKVSEPEIRKAELPDQQPAREASPQQSPLKTKHHEQVRQTPQSAPEKQESKPAEPSAPAQAPAARPNVSSEAPARSSDSVLREEARPQPPAPAAAPAPAAPRMFTPSPLPATTGKQETETSSGPGELKERLPLRDKAKKSAPASQELQMRRKDIEPAAKAPSLFFTLSVSDPMKAETDLSRYLSRTAAHPVERIHEDSRTVLTYEVDASEIAAIRERMKSLGDLNESPGTVPEQGTLLIRIVITRK